MTRHSAPASPAAPFGRWMRMLFAPAVIMLLLYGYGFLVHGWNLVSFPFEVDYGEVPELNRALLISRAQPIYVDWSSPPYQMANYTPLFPLLASLGVRLAGVQYFTGRLLAFGCTLAAGPLIALIARALGAEWLEAAIAGLLYYAMHPVWDWGAYQRVDSLAVALELAGLALFCAGWVVRRRPAAVWATVPLFIAAAYTRQTIAAGAVAAYGYLLFRRPRLALAAIGAYAAGGLAIFGLLQLATRGQFWRHIVFGNLNRWSWTTVDMYWQAIWHLLHWEAPLLVCALVLMSGRRRSQIPLLYFAASVATAVTIGKIGSSFNYLLQLCAALAMLTGLALTEWRALLGALVRLLARRPWARRPAAALWLLQAVPAIWLLVGLQQLYHVPFTVEGPPNRLVTGQPAAIFDALRWRTLPLYRLDPWGARPAVLGRYYQSQYRNGFGPTDFRNAKAAHEYVSAVAGDVLSEDMTFTITTGKRLYVQPFEFTQLAEQHVWDQGPLLADIRAHRFSAIVLRFKAGDDPSWHRQRINQPMIDAILSAYRLDRAFGNYFLYRPKEPG